MHPVESTIYLSSALFPALFLPQHPVHFLFKKCLLRSISLCTCPLIWQSFVKETRSSAGSVQVLHVDLADRRPRRL